MKIGTSSIHPVWLAVAVFNFAVGFMVLSICAYGFWFVLSDLSHVTFTRGVVLVFCFYLGGLSVATTISRVRMWRRILFPQP